MPSFTSPFEWFALIGIGVTLVAIGYIVSNKSEIGMPALAAALSAGFAAFSLVTIYGEGVMPLWTNHTENLWGIQVWWDLLLAVGLALFLLAPRARAVGMNVPLWALFVAATLSVGLLAMAARLFWLESQAASHDQAEPKFQ
ncbi:MAG: hypothetical protein ABJP34_07020 [Erythrobacter sp.]